MSAVPIAVEFGSSETRVADSSSAIVVITAMTAIVIKVVAAGLKQFPKFNASLDLAADEVIYKKYIHVGVAVDTERGLLVPVIRDADDKNLLQISSELIDLARKARDKKLGLDEMRGACFTVSNLGGLAMLPNFPQVTEIVDVTGPNAIPTTAMKPNTQITTMATGRDATAW